jgi:dTDP-4-dehydrorhamnose reductase
MKIMITGAAGMLGRDVTRAARAVNHEPISLGHDELDITDREVVERAVIETNPGAIVNCAAWTDVDGAESHLDEAIAANGAGAGIVAAAAASLSVPVIYPSSDYVFDGTREDGYLESDETNPLSAYGKSKLEGEKETAAANPRHFIVRASWLFGINGRNFVDTMLGLADHQDEVVVVRDQVGCPTFTGHLADGLVQLLDGEDYGIHHMAGGGRCSWYEFAVEIFDRARVRCRVVPTTSDRFTRPARRPAYSVLGTERDPSIVLPPWQDGLAAYLAERDRTGVAAA